MKLAARHYFAVLLFLWGALPALAATGQAQGFVALGSKTFPAEQTLASLTVFCGDARLQGVVNGPAEVRFGSLHIEGAVNGKVHATCADVHVSGGVGQQGIEASLCDVIIDGTVKGPVVVHGGTVEMRGEGNVDGSVTIHGGHFKGDESRVSGRVKVINAFNLKADEKGAFTWLLALLSGMGWLALGWWLLLIGVVRIAFYMLLALILRPVVERRRQTFPQENLALELLSGLLVLAGTTVLSVLLCLSCIGIPLLLCVAIAWTLARWFGMVVLAYIVGNAIYSSLKKPASYFAAMIVGLLVLQLSALVPLVGLLLGLLYDLLAVGITARWIYEARRSVPPRTQPLVI